MRTKMKQVLLVSVQLLTIVTLVTICGGRAWGEATNSLALRATSPTNRPVTKLEFITAASFDKMYITAAAEILMKITNSEASEAFNFLATNSALGKFRPDYGIELIQAMTSNATTFALVFASPEDDRALKYINPGLVDRAGCYLPKMRTMVIQVRYRQSPTWMALDIIHESLHAKRCLADHVSIDGTLTERSDEELRVYGVEQQILSSVGGDVYAKVVASEKLRITNMLASVGEKLGDVFCTQEGYNTNLDTAFGAPASPEEKTNRTGYITTDATLSLLNEMYAQDPAKLLKLRRVFMTTLEDETAREYVDEHP